MVNTKKSKKKSKNRSFKSVPGNNENVNNISEHLDNLKDEYIAENTLNNREMEEQEEQLHSFIQAENEYIE